jgi:hypothetical protein
MHQGLASELDLPSYTTTVQQSTSIQSCQPVSRIFTAAFHVAVRD